MHRFQEYEILSTIGSGAFATVYAACHKPTGLPVALKAIPKENSEYSKHHERLKRELKLASELDHPFIAPSYEILEDNNFYYIVMEYCENGNVLSFIDGNGAMSETQSKKLFAQLLSALEYCHTQRLVVHRDLKAENVLLDKYGDVRLVDFGLANEFTCESPFLTTACGSPAYAAPEMVMGCPYTAECDIWSLGVLLYSIVIGNLPFDDSNITRLMNQIVYSNFELAYPVSADFSDLIHRLLSKDPSIRPSINDIWAHPWVKGAELYREIASVKIRPSSPGDFDSDVLTEMAKRRISCDGLMSSNSDQKSSVSFVSYLILRRQSVTKYVHSLDTPIPGFRYNPISAGPLRYSSNLFHAAQDEAIPKAGVRKSHSQRRKFVSKEPRDLASSRSTQGQVRVDFSKRAPASRILTNSRPRANNASRRRTKSFQDHDTAKLPPVIPNTF